MAAAAESAECGRALTPCLLSSPLKEAHVLLLVFPEEPGGRATVVTGKCSHGGETGATHASKIFLALTRRLLHNNKKVKNQYDMWQGHCLENFPLLTQHSSTSPGYNVPLNHCPCLLKMRGPKYQLNSQGEIHKTCNMIQILQRPTKPCASGLCRR